MCFTEKLLSLQSLRSEMEKLMQYIWQHRLWLQQDMRTVDGRVVQVIDVGQLNVDAGPDFFNAKIKIDGEMWVGNVEIHVKASDWFRHHHDSDKAYDSVILHVVEKDDMPVKRSNGEIIPQLRMPCSPDFHKRYNHLVGSSGSELPCSAEISDMPSIYVADWLSTLAHERLYRKVEHIKELLERYSGDWDEVCYVIMARCMGFGVNSDAFEQLAMSLPLRFMGKHSDSLLSIEAVLFGQSGLLDEIPVDDYVKSLKTEYDFLAHKFSLRRNENIRWKMARMRPRNFPHRRIALLAEMIYGGFRMMSKMIAASTEKEAQELFDIKLSGYWARHYTFGNEAPHELNALSRSSINIILINVYAPLVYAYGMIRGEEYLCDRAVSILQSLPSENNVIIDLFRRAGIDSKDAFSSQALIQLRREYCEKHKCLYCRIGHRMLSTKMRRIE